MSTVKTTTGKKKRQEQTTPFLRTGMPFIVQWCRNVKDAECPPDTLLCARGRVSSLHSAAITRLSSGRQGEAHPQRDLQKTWSSREPERFLFGSDLIICQPRECVCVCMLLYIYIYLYVRRTYQETQASGPCSLDTNRYHQPLRRVRRGHRRVPRFPWSDVPWSRSEVLTQLKTTSGTTTNIKSSLQLV